jgi:hypothetical protein
MSSRLVMAIESPLMIFTWVFDCPESLKTIKTPQNLSCLSSYNKSYNEAYSYRMLAMFGGRTTAIPI